MCAHQLTTHEIAGDDRTSQVLFHRDGKPGEFDPIVHELPDRMDRRYQVRANLLE